MAEKPILFSTPMVQAILDGRKTQTRRVIKPQFRNDKVMGDDWWFFGKEGRYAKNGMPIGIGWEKRNPIPSTVIAKAKYQPGDIIWIRETWCKRTDIRDEYLDNIPDNFIGFKVDDNGKKQPYIEASIKRWRPSIHMPRAAARIFLRVKDVRVERLQDISDEDSMSEGIDWFSKDGTLRKYAPTDHEGDGPIWPWRECPRTPKGAYQKLWDSLNAKKGYGWDTNPFVWVISFEKINKEADNEQN